jgi:hypothetical protein
MISFRFTGVCLAGAALLFSQTTAPRTGDAVIRVSVDLVEVDALVTDSKGRHVPDLKPEDSDSAVDIEVKLFREGHEVYESQPMRLQIPAGIKEIPVTGKLNLTSRFLPGEYAMEFIAHDRQASLDRRTWINFSFAAQ